MNLLQAGSLKQPADLNEIFVLTKNWLKPTMTTPGGVGGATFATTLDKIQKPRENVRREY